MRVAVFSDVHGNLTGLGQVLSAIARAHVDEVVFAGDLCLGGPRPADCLDSVRRQGISAVYGNTDDWILGRQTPPERLETLCRWTRQQLDDDQAVWLQRLPFVHRVSPTNNPSEDLQIVHANPHDVNRLIFPPESQQLALYDQVRQTRTEVAAMVSDVNAAVLAYGHLHIPGEQELPSLLLVNVSSVSLPGDGDCRAKFVIFSWESGGWHHERHYVEYDGEAEQAAYRRQQPPGWEAAAASIRRDGCLRQKV